MPMISLSYDAAMVTTALSILADPLNQARLEVCGGYRYPLPAAILLWLSLQQQGLFAVTGDPDSRGCEIVIRPLV